LTDAEVESEILRKRLMIAATSPSRPARAESYGPRGVPGSHPARATRRQPVDTVDALLQQARVAPNELASEARADLLAARTRQSLAYDRTAVPDARLRHERDAGLVAARLDELRTRWKVEVLEPSRSMPGGVAR
jgi:hypothetical protein